MTAVAATARDLGLQVHLDGARLWNAASASGVAVADYAAVANSVSVCFSKGLGAPIGSAVAGSRDFIVRARRRRKALGGGMRQVGILAAACLYALDHHIVRLPEDHRRARRLAESLATMSGVRIDPAEVETNIVVFDISPSGLQPSEVVRRAAGDGVLIVPFGPNRVRAVTHLDVDDDGISRAVDVLGSILGSRSVTITGADR
jgi:threonine aldolase